MPTTRLFHNNTTQAVRLSKDVAFPDDVSEVEVIVRGEARLIVPVGRRWDYYFEHGLRVSEDFMLDREQPEDQDRAQL